MGPTSLSEGAKTVVEQERHAVAERIADLHRQSEGLHAVVDQVEEELANAQRLLRQMDELLGLAPQLPFDASDDELRGQRLRHVAVTILGKQRGAGVPIHYTKWLQLLEDVGVRIGGKNPTATFLTQVRKAPEVESVRPRSGVYRLRSA